MIADAHSEAEEAVAVAVEALGDMARDFHAVRIGADRGVFSSVWHLSRRRPTPGPFASVVVKMPKSGINGDAARRSGAYDREEQAYRSLLFAELPTPECFGIVATLNGPAFVLDDLTSLRFVDQLDGLDLPHVEAVVDALGSCHHLIDPTIAHGLGVRHVTPATFDRSALRRGLGALPSEAIPGFTSLLDGASEAIDAFASLADPVLCHGDPRADNLAFINKIDGPVALLYDWQQIAIQAGEADLAWLLATSVSADSRRSMEPVVFARYAQITGRHPDEVAQRYKTSMVVPGLAVLLLAQRRAVGRLADVVATSVERIGAAVADHLLL
ncbi:MAG: phosphotransferase [Acidimicrobiales bacterium]|nr:phosphotransferase [Acidimicrobiales bacterium]